MPVSFTQDIVALFRPGDVSCMDKFGVSLSDYVYMSDQGGDGTYADHANARNVYAHLTGTTLPRMPMAGPYWPSEQLRLFDQWMTDGFLA
jgi:hypothetical protein